MNPHYPFVARRATYRCEYCHAPEAIFNLPFEVEHIIARSRQGGDEESNLALSCRACNLRKANHLTSEDEDSHTSVPLFHPRQNNWNEHFQVSATGMIDGMTSIGRATVSLLQMNSVAELEARREWMRLGLFR